MTTHHLVSWNVNGIRAIIKRDFVKDIRNMNPDVLCLQETKAQPEEARNALALLSDYNVFVNSSKARKGYSGTAILSKQKPIEVTYDLGIEEHDQEGRVITAEFEAYYLVTVYTPNSGEGLRRLTYRKTWDEAFLNHLKNLESKKPVVFCGDLNVAHSEIDLARPKANYNKTSGYTQDEIDGFENFLASGFVDTFRHLYPDLVKYSWWKYMFNARERNVGWRIDYFMMSKVFLEHLDEAMIYNEHMGSDHCPVGLRLKF
jgi:exodeoxyribonuclease-3